LCFAPSDEIRNILQQFKGDPYPASPLTRHN
jgi:hypothetical protein